MTGLDASAQMLAYAKTQAPRAALAQGSAERLPWANESFDRVFCINAFHHFQDKVAFLTEAMRVLRPGGLMMTVGLDPHTGVDRWYIYEYFDNVLEIDDVGIRRRARSGNGCGQPDLPTVSRVRSSTCRPGSKHGRHWSRDVSIRA